MLETYDENGNDQIDRAEVREAIIHYIGGDIDLSPAENAHNSVHSG